MKKNKLKCRIKNAELRIKILFCLNFAFYMLNSEFSFASLEPNFTHYMYNTIAVNPAYAGSRGALTMSALNRSQWIGLEGAPVTQTFYIHSPLRNEKMGLGFSAINDRIGPIDQTSLYADYAYHTKLTENIKLAFGLKAGINSFPENDILIFNRWGIEVYEGLNYDNLDVRWNGTDKGSKDNNTIVAEGVYFYVLNYKDKNQNHKKSGYIYVKLNEKK